MNLKRTISKQSILSLLFILSLLISCSDDNPLSELNDNLLGGSLTANVGAVSYQASFINAEVLDGELGIYTLDDEGNILNLQFPDSYGVGTYALDTPQAGGAIVNEPAGNITGGSISGTLTITEKNTSSKKIVGTFNFVADIDLDGDNTIEVTAGSFSVTYK
ncbi:hypothetical protein ULMS_07790 [Patiriisocius marinistellae]|uniref:Uncharacterized protein n=1 Tax=Patiriisocius marinistellae TaxID=2494560 RepID=A0A5J4FZV8_9FLAO|nr:DUF6252 family protein [Patiriisocius marinistellae]GEQ85271.1 hypothetical protein ULMS_07790 [Patiriisocius marinistellae]